MNMVVIEVLSVDPRERPSLLADVVAMLTKAVEDVPEQFRASTSLSVEADGTLKVVYHREETDDETVLRDEDFATFKRLKAKFEPSDIEALPTERTK